MPSKLRIYLDTSVISACVDSRDLGRQALTRRFWRDLPDYEAHISPVVLEEIQAATDQASRDQMFQLAAPLAVLSWNEEMDNLAAEYVARRAFSPAMIQDARHVAACVAAGIPVLLSWNFRHLVNRTRRIRVNLVNSELGYGQVEILAPPELS